MAKDTSADIMQALVAKLYSTLTGNDGSIQMPRNKFISWMSPGIPFLPSDFTFCAKGLVGSTAEQTRDLEHQAWVLSKLFDFVPDISNQFVGAGMEQTIFTTTQDNISSVYRDVLKYSRVVDMPLSDKEKEKLQKFRDLLTVTKEITDIITDEKKKVTEPGPVTLAYTAKLNDYIDAADEYMNLVIDAQSAKGNSEEAIRRVKAFSMKSKFVRKKMEAAYMEWVSQGYKNEYEQINAYIDQVTMKSMVLYKQDLLRKLEAGLQTSTNEGTSGDYYYTTLVPGNFATSPGWTEFSFYEGDYETHFNKQTSQWSAGVSASFGLFSVGGSAGGSKVQVNTSQKASNFNAKFEFTQIPIVRPWFDPGFFAMKGWTLDQLWDLNFPGKKVSNGAEKPTGRLVAYPVTALFVRNLEIRSSEWDAQSSYIKSQISAGASVGWGPFRVGGSYSRGNEKRDTEAHFEGGALKIPGMQLVGYINNIIPKSPDPNPAIKANQFVGGEQDVPVLTH